MESNIRQLVRPAIVEAIYRLVDGELERARVSHPQLHSCHEAYAVLDEEVQEFRAVVHSVASSTNPDVHSAYLLREELVDVIAVAVRAILDLPLRRGVLYE